jgi:hypothetical protein
MKSVSLFILTTLTTLVVTPGLMGQSSGHFAPTPIGRVQVPRVQLTLPQLRVGSSNVGIAGFPSGPTQLPHPLVPTPANDAWARDNAWAANEANLRHVPTAENPNRSDPSRFSTSRSPLNSPSVILIEPDLDSNNVRSIIR